MFNVLHTTAAFSNKYIIFQINHKRRFTPVKDDPKQTIQVSSFAKVYIYIYIYICTIKAKTTKILKCIKTLFKKNLKNKYNVSLPTTA